MPNVKIQDFKTGAAKKVKLPIMPIYVHRRIDEKTWIIRDTNETALLKIGKEGHASNLKEKSYVKLVDPVSINDEKWQSFLHL